MQECPFIHGALSANYISVILSYDELIKSPKFPVTNSSWKANKSQSFRYMKLNILQIDPAQRFGEQRLKLYASQNEVLSCVIA